MSVNKFVLNETSYFGKGAREELPGEIQKRGFKKVYGTIERIDRNKLTKDIEDRMKSYKKVHLKILKNDNNCIEIDVNTNDFNIYNVLDDLKLNIEEISKIYYQRYFN